MATGKKEDILIFRFRAVKEWDGRFIRFRADSK